MKTNNMPLSHTQKEEIKKKWLEFVETLPKRVGETPDNVIAGFWLSILDEQLDKKVEEIREEIDNLPAYTSISDKRMGKVSDDSKIPMYGTNYLQRETVRSIPSLQTNIKK